MIETRTIHYEGARLEVLEFLADVWPHELPLDKWPSFCGPGSGWAEKLFPERICGVPVSCLCFDHDCTWPMCDGSLEDFVEANIRMYRNARRLVFAKIKWWRRPQAEAVSLFWLVMVMTTGVKLYESQIPDKVYNYPLDNPAVKKKLHRLAMTTLNYPQGDYAN